MTIRPPSLGRLISTANGRGLVAGLGSLAVICAGYPALSDTTGWPVTVFALPPLWTAVLAGWRQTLLVGALSIAAATIISASGPFDGAALVARFVIIVLAVALGATGAWFREQQYARLQEVTESATLLRAFERSLAPDVDSPAGFEVAVRYVASERHLDIGGDFVDAFALAGGRLAVVIGDVCGHGPSEAAYGTALRAAWRTIVATHRADPVEWVRRLDATFFATDRADAYVTMCTGVIDRRTRRARLVSAGHPWPVAVGTTTGVVDMPLGAALGMGPRGWSAVDVEIGTRGLLLYTDGLIENPRITGAADRWGEEGLVDWLQGRWPAADLQLLGDQLMAAALDGREQRDDIAVMLVSVGGEVMPASKRTFLDQRGRQARARNSGMVLS